MILGISLEGSLNNSVASIVVKVLLRRMTRSTAFNFPYENTSHSLSLLDLGQDFVCIVKC